MKVSRCRTSCAVRHFRASIICVMIALSESLILIQNQLGRETDILSPFQDGAQVLRQ